MEKFWLIWNQQGKAPTYKHLTLQSAKNEAERLARANPGHEFVLLEAMSQCRKSDITWDEAFDQDHIPF